MRALFSVMVLLPLVMGCGGDEEKSPGPNTDSGVERVNDTDTGESGLPSEGECTDYRMEIQEGEALFPSVVRIAFKLTCDGSPVPDKTETDFTIQEDGETISQFESDQQLVPTVAGFQLSTLLLLDMSGSMVVSAILSQYNVIFESPGTIVNVGFAGGGGN